LDPGQLHDVREIVATLNYDKLHANVKDYVESNLNPLKWGKRLIQYYVDFFW